jgi:CHAT domain-containing protein
VRPFEGRLTGPFAYAASAGRIPSAAASGDRLRASKDLYRAVVERGDASALDALGQLLAIEGDLDGALLRFRAAAVSAPADARVWSDLAAAALERGTPSDLLTGLDAAERAAATDSGLPEAKFNRALALERNGLVRAAAEAWSDYARDDAASAWGREAAARADALQRAVDANAPDRVADDLEAAVGRGDAEEVGRLVAATPATARAETLRRFLPRWAAQALAADDDAADRTLAVAEAIGAEIDRIQGDAILLDSVRAIQTVPVGRRRPLAEAWSDLTRANDALDRSDIETAEPVLTVLVRRFVTAGSPSGAALARLSLARCWLYQFRYREALAFVEALRADCAALRYRSLAARSWVTTAATLLEQGETRRSLDTDLRAARELSDLGDFESAALAIANNAGVAAHQYDLRRAIAFQQESVRLLAMAGAPDRFGWLLEAFGDRLAKSRWPYAGLRFVDEALRSILRDPNDLDVAIARLYRSSIYRALGRHDDAAADLAAADESAARLGDAARRRLQLGVRLEQARLRLDSDAAAALKICADSEGLVPVGENRLLLVDFYSVRAEAYARLGDLDAAERDLRSAAAEVEREHGQRSGRADSATLDERPHPAFERLAELLALERGEPEAAFDVVERCRRRALLDAIGAKRGRGEAAPRSIDEVRRVLSDREVLLEYVVLLDRTLVIVVRRDGVTTAVCPVARAAVEQTIDDYYAAVLGNAPEPAVVARLGQLYDALLRPVAASLPAGATLVVVPDGELDRVPFGALYDEQRGRFAVQTWAPVVAPSASVFASCEADATAGDAARALVCGDPARGSDVVSLPSAASEAAEVASLYPHADLLLGDRARKRDFLRLAPKARVVHFAGHAASDAVELGSTRLLFASTDDGAGDDLGGDEVTRLDLPETDLVVLSACSSLGAGGADRDGSHGLATPFLAAGARSVVASLWDVSDEATRRLMVEFHRRYSAGMPPAEALASAQRALLDDELRPAPTREWAPFVVVGAASLQGR